MKRKTYFSRKGAVAFAEQLKKEGFENIAIWEAKDAFNQHIYIVEWD